MIDRHLLLLPYGNFAIELERVEENYEIHEVIAHFACIKTPLILTLTYSLILKYS